MPVVETLIRAVRMVLAAPVIALYLPSAARPVIDRDAQRFLQPALDEPPPPVTLGVVAEQLARPEFRSLVYYRLKATGGVTAILARALAKIYRGQVACELSCPDIGPGLYVMHGWGTIVLARRIGRDCLISQLVTVGHSDRGGPPVIGDRVRIMTGATVIGPITIGDDALIGAGAVVVRDVSPGTVVAGVPAKAIGRSPTSA
jgi:serine O-acetyltransferase